VGAAMWFASLVAAKHTAGQVLVAQYCSVPAMLWYSDAFSSDCGGRLVVDVSAATGGSGVLHVPCPLDVALLDGLLDRLLLRDADQS
jgi:hypothetical protein